MLIFVTAALRVPLLINIPTMVDDNDPPSGLQSNLFEKGITRKSSTVCSVQYRLTIETANAVKATIPPPYFKQSRSRVSKRCRSVTISPCVDLANNQFVQVILAFVSKLGEFQLQLGFPASLLLSFLMGHDRLMGTKSSKPDLFSFASNRMTSPCVCNFLYFM